MDENLQRLKQRQALFEWVENQIRNEQSYYGKILFQQNLLSFKLAHFCETIWIIAKYKKNKRFQPKALNEIANKATLGDLQKILRRYLKTLGFSKRDLNWKLLDQYIQLRNALTHKLLTKYSSPTEAEIDAKTMYMAGKKLVRIIDLLNSRAQDKHLEMIVRHKETKKKHAFRACFFINWQRPTFA